MASAQLAKQLIIIQGIINRALAIDTEFAAKINRLAGKSLRLECSQPAIDVMLVIDQQRILLQACDPDDMLEIAVSTHLQGKLSAFIAVASRDDMAAAMINSAVRLIGDSQLLIDLRDALNLLEIDWEFHLARIVGDVPAHVLGNAARTSADHLARVPAIFARHVKEFLQQESQLLPSHSDLRPHHQQTTQLRQQIDRIEAKFQRAKQLIEDRRLAQDGEQ